jgi:CubicO group peptidase (beta-lactamase class C family)
LTYGFFGDSPVDRLYRKEQVLDNSGTLRTMVEKLGKIPLVDQPGIHFHYSVSADVLGRLVEVLAKKHLDEFFRERIFGPLDMKDTGFYVPESSVKRFGAVHGKKGNKLVVTEAPMGSRFLKKPALLSGGGGLVSTARDYARFCQMLLNGGRLDEGRILKEKTVQLMTTNQLPPSAMPLFGQAGMGFGLGFSVWVDPGKATRGSHAGEYGWGGAASTYFSIAPKDDLFVIVLQQFMPFQTELETRLKPLIYGALEKAKEK